MKKLLLVCVVSVGLAFVGCKKEEETKKEEPKKEEAKKAEPKAEEPKAEEPKAEEPKAEEPKAEEPKAEEPKAEEPKAEEPKKEEPAPAAQGGPKETVEAVFNALKAKDVTPLFGLLPPSYVKDIDGVVQAFANAMDKELWDKVVNLLDRSFALAAKNKETLVKMVTEMGVPVSAEDIGKAVDGIAETWNLIKTAGLTDLEQLKTFSLEKFAGETLPKVATQVFKLAEESQQKAQLEAALAVLGTATVKAEPEAEKDEKFGDVVKVTVNIAGDEETEKFVQVEGKWLPMELVRDWSEGIEEAKKGIAEMATELPKNKTEAMAQLAQVEVVLAQMEQTGDLSLLQQMASGFMMGMGGGAPAPEEAVPAPEAAPAEGTAPAPEAAPAEGTAPAAEAAPAPEAAPAAEAAAPAGN